MIRPLVRPGGTAIKIALLLWVLFCCEAVADVDGGIAAYKRGDYATAFSELSIAASKDDAFAQNVLGTMYAQGLGVERNYERAADWFFKAQALGLPEAMANLAKMYTTGLGLPQSNTAALQYYREAAIAGFRPAISRMAEIYERGELGLAPNTTMALEWRAQLRGPQGGIRNEPVSPAKAVATVDSPRKRKAATATLPKHSSHDDAVRKRHDTGELFEKQVFDRLEKYSQRERKLFVSSTDDTPSIAAYLKDLRTQLRSLLVTAFSAAKPEENMIVTLSFLRDGTLRDVELSKGSGNSNTNRKVLSSLKRLTRLKPLPAETGGGPDVLVVIVRLPIE